MFGFHTMDRTVEYPSDCELLGITMTCGYRRQEKTGVRMKEFNISYCMQNILVSTVLIRLQILLINL
jgi:hypothetical protein